MNAGSTSGGGSPHLSLRRPPSRSRAEGANPLCMATHNRPNGPTPRHREGREPVSGDVIVTVTLNAALHVAYATGKAADDITPISRPGYRAGGRGVTVARLLHSFGHDVLAAGLAGGASGELIIQDLARSGVPTAFTLIRGESRRFFRFSDPDPGGPALRFSEPGPYITTEELGRFAADYRRLLAGGAAGVPFGGPPRGGAPGTAAAAVA